MQTDWSILLTIFIPLLAASLTQILAHILANKRENIKYKKECFQNLYTPLITLIIEYFDDEIFKSKFLNMKEFNEKDFEKFSDPNKKFQEIMTILKNNIKYAEHDLISRYHYAKNFDDKDNHRSYANELKFQLVYTFCKNYMEITKELKITSPRIIEETLYFFHFYQLLHNCCVRALEDSPIDLYYFEMEIPEPHKKKIVTFLRKIEKTNNQFYKNFVYRRIREYLNKLCIEVYKKSPEKGLVWKDAINHGLSHIIDYKHYG
ncbi:hypothetical protein C6370_10790 [Bacillus atrophaeus]|uniref:hypothetical protein n=1 Tax=Bacillus atrophaeus TaxID=1452 RepID=UPI000D075214|nr:hypothetical protein [Bacillus atrophaeus]PSA95445.1 hypothetical protein C6370_10790 [Bacillus atrophaeus]